METVETKVRLSVGGMTCVNCQNKIEKELKAIEGIINVNVSYSNGTADIAYDEKKLSLKKIIAVIENIGYEVLRDKEQQKSDPARVFCMLVIIISLYVMLRVTGILNLLAPSQLAESKMGYGMLFVIGLLTSVHCVAMCGGINLSQSIPRKIQKGMEEESKMAAFLPTMSYNLGRVISYTAVGFVCGSVGFLLGGGTQVELSILLQGELKMVAGVFMVIMGINMLDLFPWLRKLTLRVPKFIAQRIGKKRVGNNHSFLVGVLNGFMPCGPLQAMWIVALATANPFAGALSMLLFSLGTVPLMLGLGSMVAALGKKFTDKVMTTGAVLVVVLGLSVLSQGCSLSGLFLPDFSLMQDDAENDAKAVNINGVQVVNSTLSPGQYPDISVQTGIPVKWVIDAPEGSINGCNYKIFIRDYDIEYTFHTGENVIEFTPTKAGTVQYSCWMGMIQGNIYVTDEKQSETATSR